MFSLSPISMLKTEGDLIPIRDAHFQLIGILMLVSPNSILSKDQPGKKSGFGGAAPALDSDEEKEEEEYSEEGSQQDEGDLPDQQPSNKNMLGVKNLVENDRRGSHQFRRKSGPKVLI
jgi:hypothetical protein